MPAFVSNGPEIPEGLLQAHEEGRVVFFCGAGISYPAGLPGFDGLVKEIYKNLGVLPNAIQQSAIKSGQYDTAIGLLETDHPGGREVVRGAIADILKPKKITPKAIATQSALLTLGKTPKGQLRLITTNFDRLFEEAQAADGCFVETYKAPLLPVPKNRWNGLVYLHGLLPQALNVNALHRLVVSSGDFGLAYLIERWASRFVSELFRNYTVCFVGYSINDPVLRYMMDALAADRLLGESPPEMYAFGSFSKRNEEQIKKEWQAKNVTPILYAEHKRHYYLHQTLQEWAKTYRDGVRGKQMLITQHASTPPLAPSRTDFAVGRVLWALTDDLAAKHFADLNPIPPLKWLEPLSENQFDRDDLIRFGVVENKKKDQAFQFSILRRPSPYDLSPWMCIVDSVARGSNWDDVMRHLARWLMRHLNNPTLIHWFAKNGGFLDERLRRMIRDRIETLDKLATAGKIEELNKILADSPDAVPDLPMRTLWGLFLSGRVASSAHSYDLYDWFQRFNLDGLSTALRLELRQILAPAVSLRAPYRKNDDHLNPDTQRAIGDLVNWEMVLATDHVHAALSDKEDSPEWQEALPRLLPEFSSLLLDLMELMKELGEADEKTDSSYIHQPSIAEHPQNKDFNDWTALIDLTRDAWLATVNVDRDRARQAVLEWWCTPFPIFKRLALFAATQGDLVPVTRTLGWLLSDDRWWLWTSETERETLRFLDAIGPKLEPTELHQLEAGILAGPPREMFRDEIDAGDWERIVDREVWLRLAKLDQVNTELSIDAADRLHQLSQCYPKWNLGEDEKEEFPFWIGDGDEWRTFTKSPADLAELIDWLTKNIESDHWKEDDWRQRCSDDYEQTSRALFTLSEQGVWLTDRWREALQAWSEEEVVRHSWQEVGTVLRGAPDDFLRSISHALSRWLQDIAKTFEGSEQLFFDLCTRILELPFEKDNHDEPVFKALNHPVGVVTDALLKWWYRDKLEDKQSLPDTIKIIFTNISNPRLQRHPHGRVMLAAHAITLYRVDPKWATENLLPLFNWQNNPTEAPAVWEGFLWSPRLYRPLLSEIKFAVLETANHYDELGKYASQYADFLTFAALDPGDTFKPKELAEATHNLPPEGLGQAAQALYRALEGAGDKRGEYWRNRIAPYLRRIWPKSRDLLTPAISNSFARLCIAAKEAFPEAFEMLRHWLRPSDDPHYLVHLAHKNYVGSIAPAEALMFLDLIIGADPPWLPRDLQNCLVTIKQADGLLENNPRFIRLENLVNRRAMG